ncbi:MAG: hypothetical protein EPO08_02700 [Rhodospirillaceae bacterium]|nr:MAG: hypothetical protein EPO08_02700 [Rhodospirillaceae bacterium]
MSDFMLSQVMGLLTRVSDDLGKVGTTASQLDTLLGAIDDLSANVFATQALLCLLLKDHPVKAEEAKAWITRQVGDADNAPKALGLVDLLLAQK